MIGDPELKIAKLYDMLPADAGPLQTAARQANNATRPHRVHRGPEQENQADAELTRLSTGRNFDEVLRVLDSMQTHGEAQGRDAGELEGWRRRDHPSGGDRRGSQAKSIPGGLEGAQTLLRIVPQPK